ncbi:MAG: Ig-like domain-containing protein, partial [Desulfuromonadales bacterium]|nr:Ig-like domain-containing protein [Desulfuromonadales bacterium]
TASAQPDQLLELDLTIAETPPQLLAIKPADGATGVEPGQAISVTFSEALDRASVTESAIVLKDVDGEVVPGIFTFSADGASISLHPAVTLDSESVYSLTLAASLSDQQGYLLGESIVSHFTVRDTTPPPMPPAGSISATFPDANGQISVTATQGSAEIGSTVLIINDNSGAIVAVIPNADGSFTGRINAQLGDEIQVVLLDEAGNQTLISYLSFKSDDGRYLVTAKGGKVEGEGGLLLQIPQGALPGPTIVKITPVMEAALPHAVPEQAQYLAAVQIDTGGVRFKKEVDLSVPLPEGMPTDATPFLAQPKLHVNADGSEEEVYVIHDSTKIIDGRLSTASPPFSGIQSFGLFAFVYPVSPTSGPVVVSGHAYRNMDGVSGYNPAGDDLPVKGAVIRCPDANNFISYSDDNGHYATYGFTAQDVCRNFAITGIHPQTMFRHTANITTCDAPYYVNNLDFKLADADTELPDDSAPVIDINLKVAPGQDVVFVAGTVELGTDIEAPISIIDQDMDTAFLQVEFKTPDMLAPDSYSITLNDNGSEIHTPISEDNPRALMRQHYLPQFDTPIVGASAELFRANAVGTYSFKVEALDSSGNRSVRQLQLRVVDAGEQLESIDGAPQVDEILPGEGAQEIMVTTPVMVTFSEPVTNVDETTLRLFDTLEQADVPAHIYTSVEAGRMTATLQPKRNLHYGREYQIVVSAEITDTAANPSHNDALLPLEQEYRASFTTKVPQAYALEDDSQRFEGGRDVALFEHYGSGKKYAYVTAGADGWRIVDITDPTAPAVVFEKSMSNA